MLRIHSRKSFVSRTSTDRPERYVHLHVPRSGGSYFQALMTDCFPVGNVLPLGINGETPQPADRSSPVMLSGHFHFDNPGLQPHRDEYLILLRDPRARLRSMLDYAISQPSHKFHLAATQPTATAVDLLEQPQFVNAATGMLAGIKTRGRLCESREDLEQAMANLERPNVTVGTLEEMRSFLFEVYDRHRLLSLRRGARNASLPRAGLAGQAWERLGDALIERNRLDIEMYEAVKAMGNRGHEPLSRRLRRLWFDAILSFKRLD